MEPSMAPLAHSVPPVETENDHDILTNIDLSTMNDFGLDRFVPTRQSGQQNDEPRDSSIQKGLTLGNAAESAPMPVQDTTTGRLSQASDEASTSVNPLKRVRLAREVSETGSVSDARDQDNHNEDGMNKRTHTSLPGDSSYPEEQPEGTQSPGQSPFGEEVPTSVIASHAHLTPAEMLDVPINELTPEQRRERQKEGNRLAALRSRGKKRGELATLEQTVSAIQQENAKLRARLERLLANASTIPSAQPLVQPVASGSGTQPPNAASTGGTTVDLGPGMTVELEMDGRQSGDGVEGTGDTEDLVVNGSMNDAGGQIATELDAELGFAISALGPLQMELADLKRRVQEKNATRNRPSLPEDDDEKAALIAHVRYLKDENERVERQKQTLQREIAKRKVLLARREKASEEEPEELDTGVGVERALLEVRSWLDEALQSWSSTGILQIPTQQPSALPIPVPAPRKSTRPRKERSTRRVRVNGKDATATTEAAMELEATPLAAIDGVNPPDGRPAEPTGEVAVVDPALEAATTSEPVDHIEASQLEDAQAQQNLQRLLALYSASASANEPNRNGNDERPEGDDTGEHARNGMDTDVEMQDTGEGRTGEDAGDFLAYLARETRRNGVE